MQKQIMCAGGVLYKNPKFSYSVHIMSRVQNMHKNYFQTERSVCHSGSKHPSVASLWCSAGCFTSFFPRYSTPAIYFLLRNGSDNLSFEQHFVIAFLLPFLLLVAALSPSHFGFCQPKCPWEVQHTSLLQMRAAGMRFCWNWTQQLDLIVEESFKSWCLLWSDNWQHHIMNADWRLENTIYTL